MQLRAWPAAHARPEPRGWRDALAPLLAKLLAALKRAALIGPANAALPIEVHLRALRRTSPFVLEKEQHASALEGPNLTRELNETTAPLTIAIDSAYRLSSGLLALSIVCFVAAIIPQLVERARQHEETPTWVQLTVGFSAVIFSRVKRLCRMLQTAGDYVLSFIISASHAVRSHLLSKETTLLATVRILQLELEHAESRLRTSANEITYCRSLLHERAGMLASLLLPGEVGNSSAASLHQRKFAELLSLLLDVLNWKLGQGPPISRLNFWKAFGVCEAMVSDIAANANAADTCLRQLRTLVLEFELLQMGVPLQWRWSRSRLRQLAVPTAPRRLSEILTTVDKGVRCDGLSRPDSKEDVWLLEINRAMAFALLVPSAVPADGCGLGNAWLLASDLREETEALLVRHRQQLRHHEQPTVSVRGISEERVVRARDLVNDMLRRYSADSTDGEQHAQVLEWINAMHECWAPPTANLKLGEWLSSSSYEALALGDVVSIETCSPRDGEEEMKGNCAQGSDVSGQSMRMLVLPVGATMCWTNDLKDSVNVRVGGSQPRELAPGEQVQFWMHTIGVGWYEWALGGAVHVAEVRVLPTDSLTQYGTFTDQQEPATPLNSEVIAESEEDADLTSSSSDDMECYSDAAGSDQMESVGSAEMDVGGGCGDAATTLGQPESKTEDESCPELARLPAPRATPLQPHELSCAGRPLQRHSGMEQLLAQQLGRPVAHLESSPIAPRELQPMEATALAESAPAPVQQLPKPPPDAPLAAPPCPAPPHTAPADVSSVHPVPTEPASPSRPAQQRPHAKQSSLPPACAPQHPEQSSPPRSPPPKAPLHRSHWSVTPEPVAPSPHHGKTFVPIGDAPQLPGRPKPPGRRPPAKRSPTSDPQLLELSSATGNAAQRFAELARSGFECAPSRSAALAALPELSKVVESVELSTQAYVAAAGCSSQAQEAISSLQRLPPGREARRHAISRLAAELAMHSPAAAAMAAQLQAHAIRLMHNATTGALCAPAPRAREQLRRLRSPQIDTVCEVFSLSSTLASSRASEVLRTNAQRLRGACDALGSLKRLLPAEAAARVSTSPQPEQDSLPANLSNSVGEVQMASKAHDSAMRLIESQIEEHRRQLQSEREGLLARRRSRSQSLSPSRGVTRVSLQSDDSNPPSGVERGTPNAGEHATQPDDERSTPNTGKQATPNANLTVEQLIAKAKAAGMARAAGVLSSDLGRSALRAQESVTQHTVKERTPSRSRVPEGSVAGSGIVASGLVRNSAALLEDRLFRARAQRRTSRTLKVEINAPAKPAGNALAEEKDGSTSPSSVVPPADDHDAGLSI